MSIFRTRLAFERDFVQIPNQWMRDTRLSRRARGLLAELMTHTAGWEVSIESLQESGPEGRDALRGAVNELEDCGYLVRIQERLDGNRFGGTHYTIQDPDATDSPSSEKPSSEFPSSENPPLKKTKPLEDQSEEHQAPRKRGATSIPEGWKPASSTLSWAKEKHPRIDVSRETEKFTNYFLAKGTRYKDWDRAFQNWMDRAAEYQAPTQPHLAAVPNNRPSEAFAKEMGWA